MPVDLMLQMLLDERRREAERAARERLARTARPARVRGGDTGRRHAIQAWLSGTLALLAGGSPAPTGSGSRTDGSPGCCDGAVG